MSALWLNYSNFNWGQRKKTHRHTKQISFFRPNKEVILWEGLTRVTHLNKSHHRISYLKVIVTKLPRLPCWVFQIIIHKTVGELLQNQNLLLTISVTAINFYLLALLGLITDLNDRFSYPYTSTSEIYTLSYTWIPKTNLFWAEPLRIGHYTVVPHGEFYSLDPQIYFLG